MGFFAGLNAEKYDRQYTDRQLVRRIVDLLQAADHGASSGSRCLCSPSAPSAHRCRWSSAASWICSAPSPRRRPSPSLAGSWLCIAFATWGLNWARRSLVVRAVGDVVLELRARAFEAAAEHDLSFYDQFSSGRIVSRITSDSNDFGQLVVIVTDWARRSFRRSSSSRARPHRMAHGAAVVFLRAFHLRHHHRLPQPGAPRHAPRHAGHGRRQRRHQGDGQRHLDRQELPAGSLHLHRSSTPPTSSPTA